MRHILIVAGVLLLTLGIANVVTDPLHDSIIWLGCIFVGAPLMTIGFATKARGR